MGVARYTIFHFVKMVTGSARLFIPVPGTFQLEKSVSNWKEENSKTGKIFPLLEWKIDSV